MYARIPTSGNTTSEERHRSCCRLWTDSITRYNILDWKALWKIAFIHPIFTRSKNMQLDLQEFKSLCAWLHYKIFPNRYMWNKPAGGLQESHFQLTHLPNKLANLFLATFLKTEWSSNWSHGWFLIKSMWWIMLIAILSAKWQVWEGSLLFFKTKPPGEPTEESVYLGKHCVKCGSSHQSL